MSSPHGIPGLKLRALTNCLACRGFLGAVLLALACQAAAAKAVRVGSKNFSEQFIVAELYAGALEAAGYQVERKLNLGSTFATHEALKAGSIDVYPEYTGTALTTLVQEEASADPDRVFEQVRTSYRQKYEFEWLKRSRVNNGYVIVVRPDIAAKYGLESLTDLSRVSRQLRMAITAEFAERPDGLPGLSAVYGIEFGSLRSFAGMRLRYEGMLQGRYEAVNAFATDWQITALGLVRLRDDKALFPPYELAPVARADVSQDQSAVAALNRVSDLLDTETMRDLNEQVERHGREPRAVASEFLRKAGIMR
jgi:osmoprotectant transport system substrate-binding protein